MLASLNVVLTQPVLDVVMFTSETQIIPAVLAMPPATTEMIAVMMSTVLQVNQIFIKSILHYVQPCTGPRTCAEVGITQCCIDPSGTGYCDVHFRDSGNNHCSCNASCYDRNDCCDDVHCPAGKSNIY
jgi:hypothetical protein